MPHKVETVSLDPPISMFHDVISDEEIETVKELATPQVCQNFKIPKSSMFLFGTKGQSLSLTP